LHYSIQKKHKVPEKQGLPGACKPFVFCFRTNGGITEPIKVSLRKRNDEPPRLRCPANVLGDGAPSSLADRGAINHFTSSATGGVK
jgi:hypothetical protein